MKTVIWLILSVQYVYGMSLGIMRFPWSTGGFPENSQTIMQTMVITPKVVIVSMFEPEAKAWTDKIQFSHNITVPGLSPIYPDVHCTVDYSICQVTTGEGEINAATSVSFLLASSKFDFTKSYWLLAGIAGGEPSQVSIGAVTFAKYAVQIGLQYQVAHKEIVKSHPEWPTGYFNYGTDNPWEYPDSIYGTEVFELNDNLRDRALKLSKQHASQSLNVGDDKNRALRKLYASPAFENPQILACDVLTSDMYFLGKTFSEYYGNFTKMMTNNTGTYCSTAQEENASLEALVRGSKAGMADFQRIVVLRTISNFVRAPPSLESDPLNFFLNYPKGSLQLALDNIYIGGWPFVNDIVTNWKELYSTNTFPSANYVGDIYGTLGGKPDFGKESYHES